MSNDTFHIIADWNSRIRQMGSRLHALVSRIHRAERGATLTEFVITLPVFLIIFSAILQMTLLQTTTVRLKLKSTKDLWNRVAMRSNMPSHRNPQRAAQDYNTRMNDYDQDRQISDEVDDAKLNQGMQNSGTIGESGQALGHPNLSQVQTSADFNFPDSVNGPTTDPDEVMTRQQEDYALNGPDRYAQKVADDTNPTSPPTLPAPLDDMDAGDPATDNVTVAAHAAGNRYGLIDAHSEPNGADASKLNQIPFVQANDLEDGYSTLVAPDPIEPGGFFSDDEYKPVGTARRLMGKHNDYDNYLGITFDQQP